MLTLQQNLHQTRARSSSINRRWNEFLFVISSMCSVPCQLGRCHGKKSRDLDFPETTSTATAWHLETEETLLLGLRIWTLRPERLK